MSYCRDLRENHGCGSESRTEDNQPESDQSKSSLIGTTSGKSSSIETTSIGTTQADSSRRDLWSNLAGIDLSEKHPVTGLKYGGYLPLRCTAFAPEVFTFLDPIEFKIYLYLTFLLWRYPARAGHVRASLPYIAKGTKIARSAVARHLKTLIDLGLIRCVEVDHANGNVYWVSPSPLWNGSLEAEESNPSEVGRTVSHTSESSLIETASSEPSAIGITTVRNKDDSSPQDGRQQSVIGTKDLTSLSVSKLNKLSPPIESYFASIRSPSVEKEERAILERIKAKNQDLTEAEVNECFNIVSQTRDASGKPIFKKMAWLAGGFDTILTDARAALRRRSRQAEDEALRLKALEEERKLDEMTTPEEVLRAKEMIKSLLGQSFKTIQ